MDIAIISNLNGELNVHTVLHKPLLEDVHKYITEKAIQYVHDNAGKNNYIDNFDNNLPAAQCPPGYVLKYYKKFNLDETLESVASEIKMYVNVSFNKTESVSGWMGTYDVTSNSPVGYFGALKVDSVPTFSALETRVELLEKRLKKTTDDLDRALGVMDGSSVSPRMICANKTQIQDETITLIKNFDFGTLKHVVINSHKNSKQRPPVPPRAPKPPHPAVVELDEIVIDNESDSDSESETESSDSSDSEYTDYEYSDSDNIV
jgi:hypothetical protein